MKVLQKLMVVIIACCVLSVSAFALDEPQKNDNRQPPKEGKVIPKETKPQPPPPPRNDNRGGDKKGKP
jgi:hypothetical protein